MHPTLARVLVLKAVAALSVAMLSAQAQSVPDSPQVLPAEKAVVTIPDGTPVEMRFAQPVRGKVLNPVDVGSEAQQGDVVHLVSVADIRVGGLIVIAEGAVAQATVTKIKKPLTTLVATGLGLQLDWIEDVTGGHVALRISPQGESAPFMVQVLSTKSGIVARPETLQGDIIGRNALDISQVWRDRNYIPAGTRIVTYVHGASGLDREKVEDIQDQVSFHQFDTAADVTIYRTKGHGRDRPRVLCDGSGRPIGEREYLHLNLSAGKHSCQVENQKPQVIALERAQEYFFHLQPAGSGWELKAVTIGEGEDSIEDADPAPKQ